jgi:ParB family chromosome partitioning protein
LIIENKLSSRTVRSIVKDVRKENHDDDYYCLSSQTATLEDIDRETRKVFDKSITILKMASQKLALLVPEIQENWIVSEILMQHKFVLDNQINILIKQKRKL